MVLLYPEIKAEDAIFRESFINDSYFTDNGGTKTGNPTISDGITLNGSTQYASFESEGLFSEKDPLSIEVIFFPDFDYDENVARYIIDSTTGSRYYVLKANNAGGNSLNISLGNTNIVNVASGTYSAYWNQNGFNHLVIAGTTGDSDVYLNNNKIVDADATAWSAADPPNFYVGSDNAGANTFDGNIRNVNTYNRKWSSGEVSDRFSSFTFNEIDPSVFELWLPLRSHYNTGSTEVTPNLGNISSDVIKWGDGSTATTYPTLLDNNGASFDGGDYINCGDQSSLDITATTDMTFFIWARLDTKTQNIFFSKNIGTLVNEPGYYFGEEGSRDLQFQCNDGGVGSQNIIALNVIDDIFWHSYAAVVDRTDTNKVYLYMDGELKNAGGTTITKTGSWEKSTPFMIGALTTLHWQVDGALKFPIVKRDALTPTQIRWLHEKTLKEFNR